ncbi:hypothetical protein R1sor_002284 [Riccia sorocarpa]|uniref:Uncharacterized protein n=1 Tax=Riccia sorocarpa TaxID=122646 RepID=A0ABD3H1G5_9MARC
MDDAAIVVQLTDGVAIQAALALPSRPAGVLPGADQDGAMNNFSSWLISQAQEADGLQQPVTNSVFAALDNTVDGKGKPVARKDEKQLPRASNLEL